MKTLRVTKVRILWSVVLPVAFLCAFLTGYLMMSSRRCLLECTIREAVQAQECAKCGERGPEPNQSVPNSPN